MSFNIEQIGVEIPSRSIPIIDMAQQLGMTGKEVRMHTWFLGQRNLVISENTLEEMLLAPARRALEGIDPNEVAYLIYGHTVPHVAPPSQALLERVRRQLGLNNAVAAALSQQNCSTPLYSLRIAHGLLDAAPAGTKALVLAGERAFPDRARVIRGTTVMGEATSACLVSNTPGGDEILSITHRIVGRFFEANEVSAQLQAEYDALYPAVLGETIDQAVRESGIHPECITKILPHNVNTYSWRAVMRHSVLDHSLIYLENIPRLGHCFGADPFINLHDAKSDGIVGPGDHVVLTSAGLGATFVACVVKVGS